MCTSILKRKLAAIVALASAWFAVTIAEATIVRFQTSLGNIDVRLYDTATPLTVANFLNYVNANRYDNTFIHRNPPGFVVQGGGFYYNAPSNSVIPVVDPANPDPPVMNEPGISNKRGTIAMAKLGNDPNSATSQWFFNLKDNSGGLPALDTTNGGFTVFGRVIITMSVVDAIDQLPLADLDGPSGHLFDEVPLRGMTGDPLANRLVFVNSVDVLNIPVGDYDFNGVVNAADYLVWRSSFGTTDQAKADGNGNGVVDAADYVLWRNAFAQAGGAASLAPNSVPEPPTASLLVAMALLLAAAGTIDRARSRGETA